MLTLNTESLNAIDNNHSVTDDQIAAKNDLIRDFLEKIEARDQGWYADEVIANGDLVDEIQGFVLECEGKYDHIVILGIGGSALGPICLREALLQDTEGKPELLVIDNIDPDYLIRMSDQLDLSRTLFLVTSKSGGTPETVAQYLYFKDEIEQEGLAITDHMVFITDPEKSFLLEQSEELGIKYFAIPPNVGGRFSALTPVGLLPFALCGGDIESLLSGAIDMRDQFLSEDIENNSPFALATIWHQLAQKGKSNIVLYPYVQQLFRFGDWSRQLIAESTGKIDSEGNNVGLTPIASLGVTDQHSQNQLYFEGPNDKQFVMIAVKQFEYRVDIPLPDSLTDKFSYLQNCDFGKLLKTEMLGTIGALNEQDRPNITIEVDHVDAWHLGALFFLFEAATAFVGEYMQIDAFDQPGVELSKNITRDLLLQNNSTS